MIGSTKQEPVEGKSSRLYKETHDDPKPCVSPSLQMVRTSIISRRLEFTGIIKSTCSKSSLDQSRLHDKAEGFGELETGVGLTQLRKHVELSSRHAIPEQGMQLHS